MRCLGARESLPRGRYQLTRRNLEDPIQIYPNGYLIFQDISVGAPPTSFQKHLQPGNRWLWAFTLETSGLRWGRTPANSTDWWRRCCAWTRVWILDTYKWPVSWRLFLKSWEYTNTATDFADLPLSDKANLRTLRQGMEFQPGIFESNEAQ